jgi:lysophospholipase L1-like esterase
MTAPRLLTPRSMIGGRLARAGALGLATLIALAGCSHPVVRLATAEHPEAKGFAALWAGLNPRLHSAPYYLSLGDSLARGIQPGPTGRNGPTAHGYPDQLTGMLRTGIADLRLVKLGCSGETTYTMIHGGLCRYAAGSQLAQAVRFLRQHRGSVALVTIDIGANDPNSCVLGHPISSIFGCLDTRIKQTERNALAILRKLRAAAGPKVLMVGMTYYVPELGLWNTGQTGKAIAILTEGFAAGVNQLLVMRYHRYGDRVANVFGAFKSKMFGRRDRAANQNTNSRIPPNVVAICSLTWMCAPKPNGPNEHPNTAGYHVIALAFWQAINS